MATVAPEVVVTASETPPVLSSLPAAMSSVLLILFTVRVCVCVCVLGKGRGEGREGKEVGVEKKEKNEQYRR